MIGFILALSILLPTLVWAGEVEIDGRKWGTRCNTKDSYSVRLKNYTGKSVTIKACLERKNGTWSCFGYSKLKPNRTTGWGFYVCHGTGETKWWWKDADDYKTRFPKP